ncbi:MAG: hypothetical protein R3F43_20250 [bacterium]
MARLARTWRDLLHPDHRTAGVVGRPSLDGKALLAALAPWKAAATGAWLVGVGRVLADDDDPDDLAFGTEEALGVPVGKVRQRVAAAGAAWRVVVLDVPEEHAAALRALDWGRCVLAIGPGVAAKLEAALLPEAAGPVTAGGVAAALGGRSDAPDVILNVRQAGDAAAPDELARVRYLQGLRAECGLLALASAVGGDPTLAVRAAAVPGRCLARRSPRAAETTSGPSSAAAPTRRLHRRRRPMDRVAAQRRVFLVGDPGSGKTRRSSLPGRPALRMWAWATLPLLPACRPTPCPCSSSCAPSRAPPAPRRCCARLRLACAAPRPTIRCPPAWSPRPARPAAWFCSSTAWTRCRPRQADAPSAARHGRRLTKLATVEGRGCRWS